MDSLAVAASRVAGARHPRRVARVWEKESRYVDAGRVVRTLLPDDAIILAMQHSGAVRLYAGRPTLRWDVIRPRDFDALVGTGLPRLGLRTYAVLDPEEYGRFLERFGSTATVRGGYLGRMFVTKGGVEIVKLGP